LTISVSNTGTAATFVQGDYLVISQVRMNINALGSGTTTITATLSGTSATPTTNPITFTQSSVPVASVVSPSLTVAGEASSPFVLQTCSITGGGTPFNIKVKERYPAAFTSFNDETGFTPNFTVTNGSQIQVVFTGIPAGMAIQFYGSDSNTSSTVSYTPNASTTTTTSSGSAITYTFAFVADSTSAVETAAFDFLIGLPGSSSSSLKSSTASLPPLTTNATITASVNYAPAGSTSAAVSFSNVSEGSVTVGTVGNCTTNMLFPYVTNQGGFDTSFSIANTTADYTAFGSGIGATPQPGSCTLTLWPTTAVSTATTGTAVQYTTPSIPAGGIYAFAMGGNNTPLAGQTGYIIAVCQFLNAHGFAFQTNGFASAGGPHISNGYLGLILPNPIGSRVSSGNSEALGQ